MFRIEFRGENRFDFNVGEESACHRKSTVLAPTWIASTDRYELEEARAVSESLKFNPFGAMYAQKFVRQPTAVIT